MDPGDEAFRQLIVENRQRLYSYVFGARPVDADAQDILQDTIAALLQNKDTYDSNRPFLPWAYRFAKTEILRHFDRQARDRRLFDQDTIMTLLQIREGSDAAIEERLRRLADCVQSLNFDDRRLLEARYKSGRGVEQIVKELCIGRSTLFRELKRIRRLLWECISEHTERSVP